MDWSGREGAGPTEPPRGSSLRIGALQHHFIAPRKAPDALAIDPSTPHHRFFP